MKSNYLTVVVDQYNGLITNPLSTYPAGCQKLIDYNDIKEVVGYEWFALDNIFLAPDNCKMIVRAGRKGVDNQPGTIRLLKIKLKQGYAWVSESKTQLSDLFQDCCLSANVAPTNSLASSSYSPAAGATITLTSTVADSDGTITKVQFYEGDTLLGEDAVAPYTQSVVNISKGPHTYVSKAIDNLGKTKYSNNILVNAT